ncbi:hypothetical protein BABINDRAFT_133334 [Babjeviella inositovora NRRL Y-12698]|uniref:Uncharacterized protein n=1 Tax=Babjeviella inositovora NRRL Y-12698 TaxID=984486 RepID=A0A1E3QRS3_9ASCO|nr:uncharacterized protein BABINDRAFT_133334 [Babjeviella inositovora NRRL Y-12698]ODQ80416.1 hypothetical protein BABINDRAFT_133334 [Babjeviella inositovora NRRL Y-12698]
MCLTCLSRALCLLLHPPNLVILFRESRTFPLSHTNARYVRLRRVSSEGLFFSLSSRIYCFLSGLEAITILRIFHVPLHQRLVYIFPPE